jgi:hypothetical protein
MGRQHEGDEPRITFERPEGFGEPMPTVVWLEDPTVYEYVRQTIKGTTRRRGPISIPSGGHLIGYEEHEKHGVGIQPYSRRFWWLKPHDRPFDHSSPYGNGHYPAEAVRISSVDPLEIRNPVTGDLRRD